MPGYSVSSRISGPDSSFAATLFEMKVPWSSTCCAMYKSTTACYLGSFVIDLNVVGGHVFKHVRDWLESVHVHSSDLNKEVCQKEEII